VVLAISQHNLPEPCTDLGHAIMHSALKLNLDGSEFRNHSLLRSDPPYGEGSALVALPDLELTRESLFRLPKLSNLEIVTVRPSILSIPSACRRERLRKTSSRTMPICEANP